MPKLIEAINTFLNSRNDDIARQLINVKQAAVKKEAGRFKGRQPLWTFHEYYKVDPKSAVLFKMKDVVKAKLHGDKFAEFLATWDNVMIHIGENIVDADLKGSIFEQQMEKSAKMTEYFKMYQRAPEGHDGHENRIYKFSYDSTRLIANTERYKTNRDRCQTTEYDSVPGPKRKNDPHKGAADRGDVRETNQEARGRRQASQEGQT